MEVEIISTLSECWCLKFATVQRLISRLDPGLTWEELFTASFPLLACDSLCCMWHDFAHASLTLVDRKEPSHSSQVSPACWVVSRVSTRLSADQKKNGTKR